MKHKVYKDTSSWRYCFIKGDKINLENILEKTKKEIIKNIPLETITKTVRTLGDSTRSVYPEYYIILMSSIESFKIYKESTLNLLNNLYKLFFDWFLYKSIIHQIKNQ